MIESRDYYYIFKIKNMLNIVKSNFLTFNQIFYKKN